MIGLLRVMPSDRGFADLSATIFLTPPQHHDGGDLRSPTVQPRIAYSRMPGTYCSTGRPVPTASRLLRGERAPPASWVQSIMPDPTQQQMPFDLDQAIQRITADTPNSDALLPLTGHYNNLVGMWAEG